MMLENLLGITVYSAEYNYIQFDITHFASSKRAIIPDAKAAAPDVFPKLESQPEGLKPLVRYLLTKNIVSIYS